MTWRKSPPELVGAFDAALPEDRRVQRRKMFGYPCAFTGGNMFTGLHQENLILRLPDEDRARLLREPGAAIFEPLPGRRMKEWVAVPPELIEDREALRDWMMIALDYAASLPAKKPKRAAKQGGGGSKAPAKVPPRGLAKKVKAAAGARSARGTRGR